jgi:RNA-directed DNA polymerase
MSQNNVAGPAHSHCVDSGADGFVRRRLRAILRKQEKRPGAGRRRSDHQRWPNAFFANEGLFTLNAAFALCAETMLNVG